MLLNVALHGLEEAAGVRYYTFGTNAGNIKPGHPVLVRYADDVVALCHTRQQAEQVKARIAEWLTPRGLTFNEDKTSIVHLALLTELTTAFGQAAEGVVRVPASLSA